MNTGKTLFTQLMDFLPWSTFDRIVGRYEGNRGVRKLPCAQHSVDTPGVDHLQSLQEPMAG